MVFFFFFWANRVDSHFDFAKYNFNSSVVAVQVVVAVAVVIIHQI